MKLYLKAIITTVAGALLGYLSTTGFWLSVDFGELRSFFAVFGMIYGIVAGFVLVQVLRNYGDLKSHISAEVNALQDFRDYLGLLDVSPEVVTRIRSRLTDYVDYVIEAEWPSMGGTKPVDTDTSEQLYDVLVAVHRIEPTNASDDLALKKLIDIFGEVTTHRTQRLVASRDKLPPLLRHLILFLSLVVVVTFTVIPFSNLAFGIALKAVVAFAVSFIYLLITDLNDPFAGAWRISEQLFRELRDRLEHEPQRRTSPMPPASSEESREQTPVTETA